MECWSLCVLSASKYRSAEWYSAVSPTVSRLVSQPASEQHWLHRASFQMATQSLLSPGSIRIPKQGKPAVRTGSPCLHYERRGVALMLLAAPLRGLAGGGNLQAS